MLCRLQKLQNDIETAERNEDHHLRVLKESETLLQAKRAELDKLKSQVQQQTPETSACCLETCIRVMIIRVIHV